MATETFVISGDVNVEVTITELADGTLQFDIKVLDTTGSIGDLNAIYFDISDDALVNGLSVTGSDVTGTAFKADGVTKIDNFTNMNGEVVNDLGKFDGGVQFGTSGIAKDDIRETSFILSHDTMDLTLQNFSLQDFGIRLTSVGEEGGSRDGSLKLGDTAPEFDPEVEGPQCTDFLTVTEDEASAPPFLGLPGDQLDNFEFSVLHDKTGTEVTGVNGAATGMVVAGTNGGMIYINADGTFDFDAAGDFEALNDGEMAMTEFLYTMNDGSTGLLCVTVTGITDDGGTGGPL